MLLLQAVLFLEEMASILLTPFILYFALPKCAPAIVQFVRDFSLHVDGLGDICSLATSHLEKHGNSKYGSPFQAAKVSAQQPNISNSKPQRTKTVAVCSH